MTDPTTLGSEPKRVVLHRRREKRVDHVHDIPFNDRAAVECPDCGESTSVGIYGDVSRSYGTCWTYDCDAFHKFRRSRSAEQEDTAEPSVQTTLTDEVEA